jgi:ATP-dependent exoDNAse (exonuclease V) beta subunit
MIPFDEAERRLIRENLDQNLIVEAGAGTGKTTLIVDRIIRLLDRFDLDKIVAITFTEKAASELVDRLRRELERTVTESTDSARRHRLMGVLHDIDAAHVSTIHSFAMALVRSHAIEIGIDPDFHHLEPEDEAALLEQGLIDLFSRRESLENLPADFIEAGGKISRLQAVAGLLLENSDVSFLFTAQPPIDPILVGENCATVVKELHNDFIQLCKDSTDRGYAQLLNLTSSIPTNDSREEWLEWLETLGSQKSAGNQLAWEKGALKELKARIVEPIQIAKEFNARYKRLAFQGLIKIAGAVVERVNRLKESQGLVSFHDQLKHAALLTQTPSLLSDLQDRFEKILIDEFQDTDPLQIEIALALGGLSLGQPDNVSASGRLCLVGDPKQSIYRFRRADSRLFRTAVESVSALGRKVGIVQNFRSAKGIVEFVNEFFSPLADSIEPDQEHYPALEPLADRLEASPVPSVSILQPPPEFDPKMKTYQIRRLEAAALAGMIRRIIAEQWQVVEGKGDNPTTRPAQFGDIVVLYPTSTEIETHLAALTESGIPAWMEKGKGLSQRQIGADLLSCIKAIDNPADKLSVVAAVRSSILGADDTEVEEWSQASGSRFSYLDSPTDLPEHLTRALGLLRSLHLQRHEVPPDKLLDRLVEETNLRAALWSADDGLADVDVLEHILSLARRERIANGGDLRSFRRLLERMLDENAQLGGNELKGAEGSVRMMTIHTAKGLEFPIVILVNLSAPHENSQKPILLVDRLTRRAELGLTSKSEFRTDGFDRLKEDEDKEQKAERLRLLYVGMTRAKDHLIISRIHGSAQSDYYLLFEQFSERNGMYSNRKEDVVHLVEYGKSLSSSYGTPPPGTPDFDADSIWNTRELLKARQTDRRNGQNLQRVRVLRPSVHGDEEQLTERNPSHSNQLGSRNLGIALHQYMAGTRLIDQIDPELLAIVSQQNQIEPSVLERLIRNCLWSKPWREAISSEHIMREVPVSVMMKEGYLRGVIDLLWQNEESIILLDYKSGVIDVDRHRAQILAYNEAVEKSIGIRPRGGWIVYASTGDCHWIDR